MTNQPQNEAQKQDPPKAPRASSLWPITRYPKACIGVAWAVVLPNMMFYGDFLGIIWALLMPRMAVWLSRGVPPEYTFRSAIICGACLGGVNSTFAIALLYEHFITLLFLWVLFEACMQYALRRRASDKALALAKEKEREEGDDTG